MKAVLIGILMLGTATVASAQSTFVYGPQGQYRGQVMQNPGGSQFFYGPQGQYQGSSLPSVGGTQFYYGPNGQYQGSTMPSAPLINEPVTPTVPVFGGYRGFDE